MKKKLPPFRLQAVPMTDEAARLPRFKHAGEPVGTRHQLGGHPSPPLPDAYWPSCPDCGVAMSFYGQLDSINDDYCIADAGVVHVFVCFDCNEAKAIIGSS